MLSAALRSMPMLTEGGKTLVEYVWIGAGSQLCSRTRVLDFTPQATEDVPAISVDGSSCGLAPEVPRGDVFLKPRKLFNDPLRGGAHLLCLCDTLTVEQLQGQAFSGQVPVLQPHPNNHRIACEDVMACCCGSDAAFTAEQEFAVLPPASAPPTFSPGSPPCASEVGLPHHISGSSCALPFPFGSGPSGSPLHESGMQQAQRQGVASGRSVAERHLHCCLRAGIKMADVSQHHAPPAPHHPGSHPVWSYQVGPLPGLELADQLWMSRFLLLRVSEAEGVPVSFDPAVHGGLRRGLRCAFDYSTTATRRPGSGLSVIQQHMELLRAAHLQHTLAYGCSSPTSLSACAFSVGVGSSNDCVVIPSVTVVQQAGHFRDCRPTSNSDPYLVVTMLASTTQQVPLQLASHRHVLQAHSLRQPCSGPQHTYHPAPTQASHPSASEDDHCCESDLDDFDFGEDDDETASMNSEEVLIDEIDRMDGLGPDTPPQYYGLACMLLQEGFDECGSGGCSPQLQLAVA